MAEPMTKKQQKAAAFRQKQKAKKSATIDAIPDIPEQDIDDGDDAGETSTGKDKAGSSGEGSKKRKRDEGGKPATGGGVKLADEVKKVVVGQGKGKGKAKSDWEEEGEGETGAEGEKSAKKSKKEIKQRFILFIGNLDYKTTKRDVQNHFKEAVGDTPDVRLLTTKPVPSHHDPRPKPKSRGIAFLELPTSAAMQQCLKLHHSTLQNRTINVELTAGGGGKSDTRKEKIKERNDRVGTQRERKAEKEKEEAGAGGADGQDSKASDANANGDGRKDEIIENPDGSKTRIRNGRRVKVNPNGDGNQRFRRDGPGDRRGGGGDRRGGGGGGGNALRGYGKFQPSGANAMMVG